MELFCLRHRVDRSHWSRLSPSAHGGGRAWVFRSGCSGSMVLRGGHGGPGPRRVRCTLYRPNRTGRRRSTALVSATALSEARAQGALPVFIQAEHLGNGQGWRTTGVVATPPTRAYKVRTCDDLPDVQGASGRADWWAGPVCGTGPQRYWFRSKARLSISGPDSHTSDAPQHQVGADESDPVLRHEILLLHACVSLREALRGRQLRVQRIDVQCLRFAQRRSRVQTRRSGALEFPGAQ